MRIGACSLVHEEELPHPFDLGHGLSESIQKELEHVGVHTVHDEAEQFAGLRTDGSDHVLPDVISLIRHGAGFAGLHPPPARSGIALDAALVAEPQLHRRIIGPTRETFTKGLSFLLVLTFGLGSWKAQVEVQLVQPAHGGAAAHIHAELFLEVAVDFDTRPVDDASLGGILQHGHEQIAHTFEPHLARTTAGAARHQRVNPAAIEQFDPQTHHAIRTHAQLTDLGAGESQQQGADGLQADEAALGGRGLHHHPKFFGRGVLPVRMSTVLLQHSSSLKIFQKVPQLSQIIFHPLRKLFLATVIARGAEALGVQLPGLF